MESLAGDAVQRGPEGPHRSECGGVVKLVATQEVPPVEVPPDTQVRQAVQVPEPDADEVLGAADLSRRGRAAAARLRARDDQLPGELRPGAFSLAAPYGFDEKNEFSQGVARATASRG